MGRTARLVSQLVRPRIHFEGTFQTNVGTGNNDDIQDRPPVVDTANVTVHPPGNMGDEEFRGWMQGQTTSANPTRPGRIRGGWNYYGDNRCDFIDVSVTAVELRDAPRITTVQDDPVVGAQVRLGLAVMVDLDPQGVASTQIFADSLEVVREGGLRLRGRHGWFHSRWLNRQRNLSVRGFSGASAVFHGSIPNSELEWEVVGSPALERFRADVEGDGGVSVRFCLYLVTPGLDDEALAERYRAEGPVANPAVGRVVGTLGVWRSGEPGSVAMGRLLVPSGSLVGDHSPIILGPAIAAVDDAAHRVTLDLVNTFPEADEAGGKASLGEALLQVRNGNETHDIGPVPYDQGTYEQTAGIVEVPFHPALEPTIAAGELVLVAEKGVELLAEAPVMAESDDRCVYLQQGESAAIRFTALARGAPLVQPVRFVVTDQPGLDAHRPVVEFPETIDVGAGADGVLTLRAANPGCTVLRLARAPGPRPLDTARDPYINVRVLPADDYGRLGDDELTFPLVYQEVLRYYHLLHPAMSRVLDLGDEQAVTSAAEALLQRTDPGNWHRARYMPRTRDLSAGKRHLLERWCRQVAGS
jgi:hypothetical protein